MVSGWVGKVGRAWGVNMACPPLAAVLKRLWNHGGTSVGGWSLRNANTAVDHILGEAFILELIPCMLNGVYSAAGIPVVDAVCIIGWQFCTDL